MSTNTQGVEGTLKFKIIGFNTSKNKADAVNLLTRTTKVTRTEANCWIKNAQSHNKIVIEVPEDAIRDLIISTFKDAGLIIQVL